MRTPGYNQPLYLMPFDHRGSFETKMFGWHGDLTPAQTAEIASAKQVIYDGFKSAIATGVPREKAGILVDEQFGSAILADAEKQGYTTACPAEKSGQEEFDFEYGADFARHIEAMHPNFCKVLVRYNPEGDAVLNRRQAGRLKQLSDYLRDRNQSRFLFELLVPAEQAQLDRFKGDKKAYDLELRPKLAVGRPSGNFKTPASNPTSGRSRDSTAARTVNRSWLPRNGMAGTRSAALCWAGAKMTERCMSGWPRQRASPALSALPWAGRISGSRS